MVFTNSLSIFVKTNIVKILVEPLEFLKQGVYQIKNCITNQLYIGSTTMTFVKRCQHHINRLRSGKHKNLYLQRSWNKYGEDNFEFSIVEICTKDLSLVQEQIWINKLNVLDKKKGFNINPLASGTPNMSKEAIEKRRQTMIRKYKSGELDHVKKILSSRISWNKGLKLKDTSYLQVKKTITKAVLDSRKKKIENTRNKYPNVYVYDISLKFLGKWRSTIDLQEWSLTKDNNLPIKSRFYTKRMGCPLTFLKSSNIQTACKFNTPYKNLIFSYKPLHQETDVEKQEELLGTPITVCEDNQQPSLSSNTFEGSTTNTRVLPNNMEDSNGNTSILHDFNHDDIV